MCIECIECTSYHYYGDNVWFHSHGSRSNHLPTNKKPLQIYIILHFILSKCNIKYGNSNSICIFVNIYISGSYALVEFIITRESEQKREREGIKQLRMWKKLNLQHWTFTFSSSNALSSLSTVILLPALICPLCAKLV